MTFGEATPQSRPARLHPAARVCVLGTGLMGAPIATRLALAGFRVRAWNRTTSRAAALTAVGVEAVAEIEAAVDGAEVVVTMLDTGDAVTHVLFERGAAAAMAQGTVVVDMSSIPPAVARDHATRLGTLGIAHLDAPVSGGTGGAAQGTLAIMAGGDRTVFERVGPLFEPLGRASLVGGSGAGQVAKLTNQVIVGITIGAVAEGLLLATRAGVDGRAVIGALRGGFADSRILQEHGDRMLARDFSPGGPVRLQLKDLHTALDAAAGEGLALPLAELVTALFEALAAREGPDVDHSALLLELEHRGGPRTPAS